jgi:5-methylcytosine-specific restriction endonuclease McrA
MKLHTCTYLGQLIILGQLEIRHIVKRLELS